VVGEWISVLKKLRADCTGKPVNVGALLKSELEKVAVAGVVGLCPAPSLGPDPFIRREALVLTGAEIESGNLGGGGGATAGCPSLSWEKVFVRFGVGGD
jgi:hypothetical protein